jgi:hypothetical protein
MPLPQIRPLEAYPVRVSGQDLICLRDREGIVEEPLVVSPRMFLIAAMLDGTNDTIDIQAAYARQTGGELLFSSDGLRPRGVIAPHINFARGGWCRVDAACATYLALRILEPCTGRLLRYGQAPDPAGGLVSFASAALL